MNVSIYSRKDAELLLQFGFFPANTAVISFYDPAIKRIDKDYAHVDYSGQCERGILTFTNKTNMFRLITD